MKLPEMTWPEVAALDRERTLVVLPIAACEQHGRHLPVFTDTIITTAIAEALERSLPERVLLLPTLWLGASAHHLPFGATLTVGARTHGRILEEILAPLLEDGFLRVFVLNGHGGNIDTFHVALRELQPRYPDRLLAGASYWELAERELAALARGARKVMGHACELETSMVLHLRPDLVRAAEVRDDGRGRPEALRGLFTAEDMAQASERGAIGHPEAASAESGKRFLEAAAARVVEVARGLLEAAIVPGGTAPGARAPARRGSGESRGSGRGRGPR
jgi:creatinine amidohydrolase